MELLDRLKTAPYGAFAIDLEQNIIFWNPRAERILGFEPRQVLGRKCYEVLQGLALEGAIPLCTRDCPAIAAARTGPSWSTCSTKLPPRDPAPARAKPCLSPPGNTRCSACWHGGCGPRILRPASPSASIRSESISATPGRNSIPTAQCPRSWPPSGNTSSDCPVRSPGRRYRNLGIPTGCAQ